MEKVIAIYRDQVSRDANEIKTGDSCGDDNTISCFLVPKTSIKYLEEYTMKICFPYEVNLVIMFSDKHYIYYNNVSHNWKHAITLPDNHEKVFDFDEIIKRKYEYISTMLTDNNISTIIISYEHAVLKKFGDQLIYYLSNLAKNKLLIFFVEDTVCCTDDDDEFKFKKSIDSYISQNNIPKIGTNHSDPGTWKASIANQIAKYFKNSGGKDRVMDYLKKMVGKHLFDTDGDKMKKYMEELKNADEKRQKEIEIFFSELGVEYSTFNLTQYLYTLELKIIEIQYGVLPCYILHITSFHNDNYNTLLLDSYYKYIPHIETMLYNFKTTMIYNFTNYDKHVCKNKPLDELSNVCIIFDNIGGYNKICIKFAKCLINNTVHSHHNIPHKNIIVYTSNIIMLDTFDEIVVYRKK